MIRPRRTRRAAAPAGRGVERRQIAGPVPEERHPLLAERREDELARHAGRHGLERLRVDDLRKEVVLGEVHPLPLGALDGHPGPRDLGEPVDVEGHQAEPLLDGGPHGLGPGLRAEEADPEAQRIHRHTRLLDRLRQVERIGGRAAEHRAAEVLERDELALGEAAGHGDDGGTHRLRAVVEAQAPGEETVAVGVLHDVAGTHAAGPERPAHHFRPDVQVAARVRDHGRLAGGPGGGVDAHDLVHRHREQPERIGVAEVRLRRERQPAEIVERPDVSRPDLGGREALPVERHPGRALEQRAQALHLEPGEVAARQPLDRGDVAHVSSPRAGRRLPARGSARAPKGTATTRASRCAAEMASRYPVRPCRVNRRTPPRRLTGFPAVLNVAWDREPARRVADPHEGSPVSAHRPPQAEGRPIGSVGSPHAPEAAQ